jgi:hypothetical protein
MVRGIALLHLEKTKYIDASLNAWEVTSARTYLRWRESRKRCTIRNILSLEVDLLVYFTKEHIRYINDYF